MTGTPLPPKALEQHIIALGKTGSGKSSKMRVLVEGLLDRDSPVCIIDPKGDWWGLKSSASGKSAGYPIVIFGGEHGDVPINRFAGAQVAELVAGENRPCLIDLTASMWLVGERLQFFTDFAASFFKHARGKRHLVIDEVHKFAPQGRMFDVVAAKALHWANTLASEGRGRGITLIAASQRPQKVHKDFLTSCETLIACRVIHKLDRDAISDWIDGCADPEKGKEVLRELATMPRGEAWCWSPEIDYGPVRSPWPMFRTYDSFRPQEASTGKLKGWADVDLAKIRTQLEQMFKEADANDPVKLRARLAELERSRAKPSLSVSSSIAAIKAERQAAEQRGYERGVNDGKRYRLKDRTEEHRQLRQAVHRAVDSALNENAPQQYVPEPLSQMAQSAPERGVSGAGDLPRSRMPAPQGNGSGRGGAGGSSGSGEKLRKAERSILTALAQYPDGRTKRQIAILSGYAHSGGGFNNALSWLRSQKFMQGERDGLMSITPEGLEALGSYDPLPRGQALLAYWLEQLPKAEREILQVLHASYPKAMTKEEIAAATPTQYEAAGGGFNNALSRLRSLELIGGRGELSASEELF